MMESRNTICLDKFYPETDLMITDVKQQNFNSDEVDILWILGNVTRCAMAIVIQTDKRTGITYAYETQYHWDKEKKQSRSKRV